jgi:hypothetical protein
MPPSSPPLILARADSGADGNVIDPPKGVRSITWCALSRRAGGWISCISGDARRGREAAEKERRCCAVLSGRSDMLARPARAALVTPRSHGVDEAGTDMEVGPGLWAEKA